ncbi:LAFE_0G00782g1_1 [Lachancea fermentati]|uniref:LAFE_0G00782g1_1 n=1 Tax=Lachancea fermentati TaxID=4955 RepID=A0A1G4MGW4_LACFM|nr:LAFE_0G00782g1_1 [Lachancea fermentati]
MHFKLRTGMRLLIVNPNSTQAMTDAVRDRVQLYLQHAYRYAGDDDGSPAGDKATVGDTPTCVYFTAPADAPPQIDGEKTSRESCEKCLPLLCARQANRRAYFDTFDGVLIACFSDHPLVAALRARSEHGTPVVGIFHAAMLECVAAGEAFSVITSNDEWVALLDAAVARLLGCGAPTWPGKDGAGGAAGAAGAGLALWRGTVASGVPVLDLHDERNFQEIAGRVRRENVARRGSRVVVLGCAGFSGMERAFARAMPPEQPVRFVDSVVAGLEMLAGRCRLRADYRAVVRD